MVRSSPRAAPPTAVEAPRRPYGSSYCGSRVCWVTQRERRSRGGAPNWVILLITRSSSLAPRRRRPIGYMYGRCRADGDAACGAGAACRLGLPTLCTDTITNHEVEATALAIEASPKIRDKPHAQRTPQSSTTIACTIHMTALCAMTASIGFGSAVPVPV